ncbi:MAG: lantibiotic immunity ABC transporter MutE/EpiE family permease subunit [Lachnospiraceae bacterium]|nr:lantibiotic immunity ABC transporter MutE/EpiE family permease subunit [Lachnospiraceae bacterium]
MVNCIKSEFLKQKHRFPLKLLCIAPIITIVLVLTLMGGNYFLEGTYNWWYTIILPGALSLIISFTISFEKRHNRHGLLAVCVKKEELWIAQIITNICLLLLMNLMFSILIIMTGLFLRINIPIGTVFEAGITLTITYLWQIPICMWLSERMGSIPAIVLSLLCNIGIGLHFAPTRLWFVPFAIPARLMCPILKVLPNGLPIEASNPLSSVSVIWIGITITVILFMASTIITSFWFQYREVK